MDLETFNNRMLKTLNRWSHLGDKVDEYGTKYIGHYNKDVPFAFLHELHKSASRDEIVAAEHALGKPLPKQFREFLSLFNGASFFNPSGILIFGVKKPEYSPEIEIRPWRFPCDIVKCNSDRQVRALPNDALVIGRDEGIGADIICRTQTGSIIQYDPLEPDDFSNRWPSFDEWIISEIEELSIEHDSDGRLLETSGTCH